MEFKILEVAPEYSRRTELGRVVVNPPNGPVEERETGKLIMCCGRAFLTELSYKSHREAKENHDRPVPIYHLPSYQLAIQKMGRAIFPRDSTQFWMTRKMGIVKKDVESDDEIPDLKREVYETQKLGSEGKHRFLSCSVNDVDKSRPISGRGRWVKCPICNLSSMYCNMERHMRTCHSNGEFKCEYCPCTFVHDSSRKAHQNKMHPKIPAVTLKKQSIIARAKMQLVNSKSSNTVTNLRKYVRGKVYKCTLCEKTLESARRLRDHMNTHTGARPYRCDICGFRFSHFSNVVRHKRNSHTKDGKFFCNLCNCTFSNVRAKSRHIKVMHPQKLKIKRLHSPGKEVRPTEIVHMEDIPLPSLRPQHPSQNLAGLYECHVCQKQLSSPHTWRGHMLIHQNIKPHKCNLCGNHFRLISTLAQHKKLSHTNGNFPCKDCTCRFRDSFGLQRHNAVYHSKKRKKPSSQLNTQMQRYVTELPQPKYKCNICERVLPSLEDYKKHELVHSNLKPTQCDLCLKEFAQKVCIVNHKKRAHKNGPYKCSFCCCRYNVTQSLFTHLVREHAIMREDWNFKLKSLKPEAIKRLQPQLSEPSTTDDQSSGIGSMINGIAEPNHRSIEQTSDFPEFVSTGAWQCNVCPQAFHSHTKLLNHKKIVHKLGKFKCPSCPFRFIKRAWLHKHQLAFHGTIGKQKEQNQITSADFDKPSPSKNTFDCSQCGKVLSNDKALKCHIIIHHRGSGNEFKCNLCGLKFSAQSSIKIHKKRAHHHTGKFKCAQCSCKFLSAGGLINHRTVYHGYIGARKSGGTPSSQVVIPPPRRNMFKCRHCDKILPGKIAYRIHVLGHATAKNNECDLCHMKLLHRSSIIGHKKQCHNHDGKFQCSKCSCKFVTSRGLENHTQLHHTMRDKKPKLEVAPEVDVSYDSPEPKFSNAQPENLEIDGDTTQLSLECRYCHKILSSKSNLRTHLNVHTRDPGERKHECDLCDMKFSHPGSVWKHKRIAHTRNGKFKCPDCSCKFLVEGGLIWHQLRQHKSASSLNKQNVVKDSNSMTRKDDASKGEAHNLSKKAKCDLCHLWLNVNNLPTHRKKSHFHDGQFECTKCTCKFLTSEGVRAHASIYHKDLTISPQISTVPVNGFIKPTITTRRGSQTSEFLGTTGVEKVFEHSPRRKREKLAECNLCNRKVNVSSLVKHKAVAHSNGQYKCKHCTCCFHTVTGLTKHNDWHDPLFAKLNTTRSDTRIISSNELKKRESETSGLEESQEEDKRSNVPSRVNRNFLKIRGLPPAKRASPKKTNSPSNISSVLEQNKSSAGTSAAPPSRHVTAPNSRGHWKCHLCGITFGRRNRYEKHKQTAHTDGQFKCKKCPCVFQNGVYLGAHTRTFHNPLVKGIYNTFTAKKAAKFRQLAKKKHLPTDQTNKAAPPLTKPRVMKVDANSKDWQSKLPGNNKQEELDKISGGLSSMVTRSSRRSDSTERHVVSVTATAPTEPVKPANVATPEASALPVLKCSYCAKVFHGHGKLKIHILSHTRPAQCPKCLNRFRTKDEVTKHMQTLHGNGAFQCYICTCRFGTKQGLKQHMSVLHKAKSSHPDSITIEHDQEEFVDSESLIQEIYQGSHTNRTHADNYFEESEPILEGYMETRYLSNGVDDDCIVESEPIVQGILTTSYTVNNEEFVDESEPQVQENFELETPSDITASSLPQPVASNRAPYTPTTRPIKCTTCGVTCYGPANLRLHMKSHEEESAASDIGSNISGGKCSKCGYEFASRAEIMQHLKIEHDETGLYRCAYCTCTMKTEPALRDHFMKYHSG